MILTRRRSELENNGYWKERGSDKENLKRMSLNEKES